MVLLLVGLVAVDLLMALFTWRLEFAFSAQARGEAEAWAAAGGFQVGPFTASAVAARGVSPRAELFAFGRCVRKLPKEGADEEEEADEAEDPALERAKRALRRGKGMLDVVDRRWGLAEVAEFLLDERKRIVVQRFDVDLAYSFRDVILTGKFLAALSVLSGLVPPPVAIRHTPSWEWEDKLNGTLAGTIYVWPMRLLVDGLWFVVRKFRVSPRRAVASQEG